MKKALLLSTVCLVLLGCSEGGGDTEVPAQSATAAGAEVEPLSYIEPTVSDANLDSDVAPYVLARGAGPARLSPDGGTIVTRLSLTGTRQIYVMDASAGDPKSTLNQLTDGSGDGASSHDLGLLKQCAAMTAPDSGTVEDAASRLVEAAAVRTGFSGTDAERAGELAELLEAALDFHEKVVEATR